MIDPQDLHQVVTTDMLLEGVHFDLGYVPLKHLGYKAIIVNLSDVYAMNAIPRQVTVALALSNRFPVEAVDELYDGMLMACANYGVDLVGGDTCSSTSGLVISITAVGAVPNGGCPPAGDRVAPELEEPDHPALRPVLAGRRHLRHGRYRGGA